MKTKTTIDTFSSMQSTSWRRSIQPIAKWSNMTSVEDFSEDEPGLVISEVP
jgi:hypothetical protein